MAAFTAFAIATLIAAGVSAYKAHKAAQAQKATGTLQRQAQESVAGLDDWNAQVNDWQAADAEARGAMEEDTFRKSVNQVIGKIRAGQAAGNIDVNVGSAVDVQADAAQLGELDALTIRTNAARAAWGFKVQAYDNRQRGVIARREGIYLERAGAEEARQTNLGAAASFIGSGTSLLQARYGF